MSDQVLLRDLVAIPDEVHAGDFVLSLAKGVGEKSTITEYVVTEPLAANFDRALGLIKSAVETNASRAAYLDGSFGSGKSHFITCRTPSHSTRRSSAAMSAMSASCTRGSRCRPSTGTTSCSRTRRNSEPRTGMSSSSLSFPRGTTNGGRLGIPGRSTRRSLISPAATSAAASSVTFSRDRSTATREPSELTRSRTSPWTRACPSSASTRRMSSAMTPSCCSWTSWCCGWPATWATR